MEPIIRIQEYTYVLPSEKIALHPLPERDQSKLLVYRDGVVTHRQFRNVTELLPENAQLYFNDTKVIPARLIFQKETGAEIEIFLLHPVRPSTLVQEAMTLSSPVQWQCSIGNKKRWPAEVVLTKKNQHGTLDAELVDRENDIVEFRGTPARSFAELISSFGETPLPPYLKRKPIAEDHDRYQTVYSHFDGAVAAPTAGLHFTNDLLNAVKAKGILSDYLTLHVSAGTFQPVKVENALDHTMHHEQIVVRADTIQHLLQPGKTIVAVGTTSVRTLESLYWYGVKLIHHPEAEFIIQQMDPYQQRAKLPTKEESLNAVSASMKKRKQEFLSGETSIFILPGYTFHIVDVLITNFHQPGSTLLLLIAAFVGKDWKKIYDEALNNDYRFLSYGDSSMLWKNLTPGPSPKGEG